MIITRFDAIQEGLKYYFTGVPCPKGHVSKRKVHNSTCYQCAQEARDKTDRKKATKRINPKRKVALPHPEYQRNQRAKIRQFVIDHLGGKCVKCGFSDTRALQIDHVSGGGKQELSTLKGGKYYKQVIKDQTGKYQLLCANCNWIKRIENGEVGSYLKSR